MITMFGVRDHCEGYPVLLKQENGRLVVEAWNEGGNNATQVDLLDLIDWLRANQPELLKEAESG